MDNNPILSIVVPTKNRYETLSVLIKSVLDWESDKFELIIQDNSDNNEFILDFLLPYKSDCRLKYFYQSKEMSAIENCDLAVGNTIGEYVTFIGDDDGLLRQTIEVVEWMHRKNVDALYCNIGVYVWPDMKHSVSINKLMNGMLFENNFTGYLKQINVKNELEKVIKIGAQDMYKIPRLYQGIVSKIVLEKLKTEIGSYFPGPVPDMANAVGIIPYVNTFYYTDIPIIVSGQCSKSMSGKNSQRKHQGEIKSEKSLPKNTYENWSENIPKFWSAPTIWAEAFIQAATITHQKEIITKFNYNRLYAGCFAYCKTKYYPLIFISIFKTKNKFKGILSSFIFTSFYIFSIYTQRAKIFFSKIFWGIKGDNFNTIKESLVFLENKVEKNVNLNKLLS